MGRPRRRRARRKGWHIAAAQGLPNRYITSVAIDPRNAKNIFVTLGGYTRRWLPAGAVGDANTQIGTGHVFRSTDAGQTFTDVTGNLPDAPASWVELRGDQLLVATDVGAFASQTGGAYATPKFAPLKDIPATAVSSIALKPGDPNTAVVAVFGRGVWTYSFKNKLPVPVDPPPTPTPTVGTALCHLGLRVRCPVVDDHRHALVDPAAPPVTAPTRPRTPPARRSPSAARPGTSTTWTPRWCRLR